MKLNEIQARKTGDRVHCPEDRGDKPYEGTIDHIGTEVCKNSVGSDYVWVTVKAPGGTKHVWPSNRLG